MQSSIPLARKIPVALATRRPSRWCGWGVAQHLDRRPRGRSPRQRRNHLAALTVRSDRDRRRCSGRRPRTGGCYRSDACRAHHRGRPGLALLPEPPLPSRGERSGLRTTPGRSALRTLGGEVRARNADKWGGGTKPSPEEGTRHYGRIHTPPPVVRDRRVSGADAGRARTGTGRRGPSGVLNVLFANSQALDRLHSGEQRDLLDQAAAQALDTAIARSPGPRSRGPVPPGRRPSRARHQAQREDCAWPPRTRHPWRMTPRHGGRDRRHPRAWSPATASCWSRRTSVTEQALEPCRLASEPGPIDGRYRVQANLLRPERPRRHEGEAQVQPGTTPTCHRRLADVLPGGPRRRHHRRAPRRVLDLGPRQGDDHQQAGHHVDERERWADGSLVGHPTAPCGSN